MIFGYARKTNRFEYFIISVIFSRSMTDDKTIQTLTICKPIVNFKIDVPEDIIAAMSPLVLLNDQSPPVNTQNIRCDTIHHANHGDHIEIMTDLEHHVSNHSHGSDPNKIIHGDHCHGDTEATDVHRSNVNSTPTTTSLPSAPAPGQIEVPQGKEMTWRSMMRLWRFFVMGFFVGAFMIIELIIGITIKSLALQADAFHMLSDLVALGMAFYAALISDKKETDTATFGMSRAEIIGGLINAVFLLASCFFITLDAIQRFAEYATNHVELDQINTLIIVGGLGLFINLIGIFIFGSDGSGHGHSHGGENTDHDNNHAHGENHAHGHGGENTDHNTHNHEHKHETTAKKSDGHNSRCCDCLRFDNKNIKALFMHIMADALGSVGVIISGLIIKYVDSDYRWLADPAISIVIVLLIISSAIPLVRECVRILMHIVPNHIDLKSLRNAIHKLRGIQDAHHLHVWQLNDAKIIASVHLKIDDSVNVEEIMVKVEELFHNVGIHSTTIQVENVDHNDTESINECTNLICNHEKCKKNVCCNNNRQTFLVNNQH